MLTVRAGPIIAIVRIEVTTPAASIVRRVRDGGRDNLVMVLSKGCCDSTAPYLYDNYVAEPDAQAVGEIDGVTVLAPAWLAKLYPATCSRSTSSRA